MLLLKFQGNGEIDWTEFLNLTRKRMKKPKESQTETAEELQSKETKPKKVTSINHI